MYRSLVISLISTLNSISPRFSNIPSLFLGNNSLSTVIGHPSIHSQNFFPRNQRKAVTSAPDTWIQRLSFRTTQFAGSVLIKSFIFRSLCANLGQIIGNLFATLEFQPTGFRFPTLPLIGAMDPLHLSPSFYSYHVGLIGCPFRFVSDYSDLFVLRVVLVIAIRL